MVKLKNLFQALLLVLLFVLPGCRRVEYRTVQPENPQMKYLLFPVKGSTGRAVASAGRAAGPAFDKFCVNECLHGKQAGFKRFVY